MPAPQRRDAAGVIEQLLREPQQFSFFQAVRLLDRWMAAGALDGQGLSRLNFRNSLSLSFPASEIESLAVHWREGDPGAEGVASASQRSDLSPVRAEAHAAALPCAPDDIACIDITPAFMGLLGVLGALPLFYTETLAQRELYQKDHAARAFMDVFSHRAVALFYQAWRKHRMAVQYEADQRQGFLPQVLALAGVGQRRGGEGGDIADEALAFHAGALQQRTLSVRQLQQVLRSYLKVPVRIEQFVGRWYPLPEEARGYLGVASGSRGAGRPVSGVLGRSAMLGERVWQRDLRMRVVLGPLDHARFRRFLPGGPGAAALKAWLTMLSGVSLEYEINLQLKQDDVQGCALASRRPATQARLGWDTFLLTRPATQDRADVRYDIHAAA